MDRCIIEYKKLKSGKYVMYTTFITSSGMDGGKIGETWVFAEVMDKRDEIKRQFEKSGYKFESRRV